MANNENNKQPEDIFADVSKTEKKPRAKKNRVRQGPASGMTMPEEPETSLSNRPKYIIIIGVIFVLVAIGVIYVWFFRNSETTNTSDNTNTGQINQTTTNTNTQINTNSNTNSGVNSAILNMINEASSDVVDDTDKDGLTDGEEAEYGTDKTLSDTDGDGLSDKQEIVIYKSDPKDSDSDNDGFNDGEEVESGYDPNGSGELYDINKAVN